MSAETKPTEKIQIIVPTKKVITVDEPSRPQMDAFMVEKALEVQKIEVEQELTRQITANVKEVKTVSQQIDDLIRQTRTSILASQLTFARRHKGLAGVGKALTELLGEKVSINLLVKAVRLEGDDEESTFGDSAFLRCFRANATEVGIRVDLGISVFVLASAKEAVDADSSDLDEDSEGRPTVKRDGWSWWSKVTAEQASAVRQVAVLERQYDTLVAKGEELKERKSSIKSSAQALKAEILRQQIRGADGGEEVLRLMDGAKAAALNGDFLALL